LSQRKRNPYAAASAVARGVDPGCLKARESLLAGVTAAGYNEACTSTCDDFSVCGYATPIYFVTTCTYRKKRILACEKVASILSREWKNARERHGWAIGRYVIMPDHVHFFCAPELDAKTLSIFAGLWKEWTSKAIKRQLNLTSPVWQEEFFDHVLRSSESYSEKWNYVRNNPVRHGLVADADDWPWQGEIEELRL
jgi:REP element-mobilizing transposase RayT